MSFKNARRLFAWKVESVIENMMQPMKIPECRTFRFPGLSIEYCRIIMMKIGFSRILPVLKVTRHEIRHLKGSVNIIF